MNRFGIYIHIPFCKKKCNYCDFISFSYMEEKIEKYFECLNKEILNTNLNKIITTIYIGGGTPSFVDSKYIVEILNNIKKSFKVDKNAEITIEINPGTITKQKLIDYRNCGINRISLGLQTTNDRLLKLIGRIHNYNEFINCYELVKEVGFKNINIDLMLGLPTQTNQELIDSVNKVINLKPNHISLYSLILEEKTPIKEMIDNGQLEKIDEDLERKMYWTTKKILEKNGYIHYEISNFSKKGCESKHNLDCWDQEEYIGFGISAHSYINGKRFSNTEKIDDYIENIENKNFDKNIIINEIQEDESKMKEYMMLGLRKIEGVSISEFESKFRINPLLYFRFEIDKLSKQEILEVDLDKIRLTKKGLDFANLVFEEFI